MNKCKRLTLSAGLQLANHYSFEFMLKHETCTGHALTVSKILLDGF